MNLGFATAVATGAGVYFVYGEKGKFAAISAVLTGAVLYAAYYLKLNSNPKINGFMSGNKKTKSLSTWTPMTDEEINSIKNYINGQSIQMVSDP